MSVKARRKPNGHRSTKAATSGARAYGSTPSWGRSAKHWTREWRSPDLADWFEDSLIPETGVRSGVEPTHKD